MACCQGAPVFVERIGRGFALDSGDGFFDFLHGFRSPTGDGIGTCPIAALHLFLCGLEAIASGGQVFQSSVDVTRIVVLTMSTKPKEIGYN